MGYFNIVGNFHGRAFLLFTCSLIYLYGWKEVKSTDFGMYDCFTVGHFRKPLRLVPS